MIHLSNITFANKEYLFGLLIILPFIVWYILKNKRTKASVLYSDAKDLIKLPKSFLYYLRHLPFILKIISICFIILALARPQNEKSWQDISTEGIDIVIASDISTSMLAQDLKPNRLEASKNVGIDFINGRPNDRIGLVIFAGESFTQCPVTIDHAVLINQYNEIREGYLDDGTAIGVGLANAINRLKNSDAKTKVIILLTDGVNNTGEIAPITAAEIASSFGIRVYTIGVGNEGLAPYPIQTPFGVQYQNMKVEIDEAILQQIAKKTDGRYFRATNNKKLKEIYEEIDKLEKIKFKEQKHKNIKEDYLMLAFAGLFSLLLAFILELTALKSIS